MGKPKLEWSSIKLCMENQQNIIPMGYLHGVVVDIEGTSVLIDFEVMEIVDDSNPYPTFLGIDCDFDIMLLLIWRSDAWNLKRMALK